MGGAKLFSFLLILFLLPSTLGVGIGVNKARIDYNEVLQNGYAQESIVVSTDSDFLITGTYELEGELAPWIRIEPENLYYNFSRTSPYQMKIIVEPPPDARLQDYSGAVRLLTGEIARTEGGRMGTSTRAAFLIKINLGVTGTERLSCKLGGITIRDSELDQPFDFLASVQNTGNVRIQPGYNIVIFDQYQENELANISLLPSGEILPTETVEQNYRVDHNLEPGQYFARIYSSLCTGGSFLTFDILERGGIADKGELIRIDANPWANTGDIIPIYAVFKNTGSRVVSARFQGTITTQDSEKIYKVIDTLPVNVRPGETINLETFFNPTEPGRYIVAGRVLYNKKLTFQKSAILNVQGPFLAVATQWSTLFFILLLIAILILLILIKRKKRQRQY